MNNLHWKNHCRTITGIIYSYFKREKKTKSKLVNQITFAVIK